MHILSRYWTGTFNTFIQVFFRRFQFIPFAWAHFMLHQNSSFLDLVYSRPCLYYPVSHLPFRQIALEHFHRASGWIRCIFNLFKYWHIIFMFSFSSSNFIFKKKKKSTTSKLQPEIILHFSVKLLISNPPNTTRLTPELCKSANWKCQPRQSHSISHGDKWVQINSDTLQSPWTTHSN